MSEAPDDEGALEGSEPSRNADASADEQSPTQASISIRVRKLRSDFRNLASATGVGVRTALDHGARKLSHARLAKSLMVDEKDFYDRIDSESLVNAALPENEELGLNCIWVTEVYLASHIGSLQERLAALHLRGSTPLREDIAASIIAARETGHRGWYSPVGVLVRKDSKHDARPIFSAEADLPLGISSVYIAAIIPVPSAVVLVSQFRIEREAASGIETPFRTKYNSRATVVGKEIRFLHGAHVRDDAVADFRSDLRRRCERWVREHLPGAFASFGESERFPSCELLTFANGDPLGGRSPPARTTAGIEFSGAELDIRARDLQAQGSGDEDYLGILGQRDDLAAWACVEMPALVLRYPRGGRLRAHAYDQLVLSTRLSDFRGHVLPENSAKKAEKQMTAGDVISATSYLSHSLSLHAISRLMSVYEKRMARIRDSLGDVALDKSRLAVRQMERVERDLSKMTRDARPLMNDIVAAPHSGWQREVYTFLPLVKMFRGDTPYFSAVASGLVERSRQLLLLEAETRLTAQTISGLVSATANLRAARINGRLQFAALIVAVAAFAAAAVPGGLANMMDTVRRILHLP